MRRKGRFGLVLGPFWTLCLWVLLIGFGNKEMGAQGVAAGGGGWRREVAQG